MYFKHSIAALSALAVLGLAQDNQGFYPKRALGTGVETPRPTETIYSSITLAPVPLSTGASGPPSVYSTVTQTGDVTLTYTLGSGTSTSVVTTTIHRTATDTTYVTITPEAPRVDDLTTTTTLSSTSTKTVTVEPAATGHSQPGSQLNQDGSGSNGGAGGDSCSGQVTVTVTEKVRETVTVTATPDLQTPGVNFVAATSAGGDATTVTVINEPSQTASPGNGNGESTVTVSGAATHTTPYKLPPAPSNSGQNQATTAPYPTPESPRFTSSGFLTSKKALPTGYGAPMRA